MTRRIVIIQGHPDPAGEHFGHALAENYARGARDAGLEVTLIEIAKLDFPLLRSQREWQSEDVPPALAAAQQAITESNHLVIFFPLWLGDMPALLKGFLEQVLRPGFAFSSNGMGGNKPLAGKSARIVVTMGMPGFFYRTFFRAHSVRNLKRNILHFIGIRPVRTTLVGGVERLGNRRREKWFEKMRLFGAKGVRRKDFFQPARKRAWTPDVTISNSTMPRLPVATHCHPARR